MADWLKRDPVPPFEGLAISPPSYLPTTFPFFAVSLILSAVTFYASKLVSGPFGFAVPGLALDTAEPPS